MRPFGLLGRYICLDIFLKNLDNSWDLQSQMGVIYMQSRKQCTFPVITTMAGFVSTNAQEHSLVYNKFIITFDGSMFLQRVNYDVKSRMKDMKLRHYKNV